MSKPPPPGFRGRRLRSTKTMSKPSKSCALAFGKPSISPKAYAKHKYEGAEGRKVSLSWVPGKVIGGEDYLLQITIPNVYFHIAMTYAVLRNGGVDVGKMDFLGPMNFVEA